MTSTTIAKTHVSLNVSNVETSTKFYEAFFGEKVHKVRSGYANFDLNNPPLKLALNEVQVEKGKGSLSHLGIVLNSKEEVQKGIERLKEAGLITLEEKNTTCCYAVQDKVWVSDPDGNKWEVYVILDEMIEENKPEDVSKCCPDPVQENVISQKVKCCG